MSYKIKCHQFIVKDAFDFYKHCREHYQTPVMPENSCQHYRIQFQFIRPSVVNRHHDCDLDQPIPNTHDYYSICNTPEPLKLKVRKVPYLCPPCIKNDITECFNSSYTDDWRTVHLIPKKKQPQKVCKTQKARCGIERTDRYRNSCGKQQRR